jgi:hypothetical protein
MKVLNLSCARDHRFEGWFASEVDYLSQAERGLVECPLCGDKTVTRLPSAPHVLISGSRELVPAQPSPPMADAPVALTQQAAWLRAVQHVIAHTDDVGERFAEEARRMHYGETEERPIRGQASRDEAQALVDEGIAVMPLPIPAALKGPIQ